MPAGDGDALFSWCNDSLVPQTNPKESSPTAKDVKEEVIHHLQSGGLLKDFWKTMLPEQKSKTPENATKEGDCRVKEMWKDLLVAVDDEKAQGSAPGTRVIQYEKLANGKTSVEIKGRQPISAREARADRVFCELMMEELDKECVTETSPSKCARKKARRKEKMHQKNQCVEVKQEVKQEAKPEAKQEAKQEVKREVKREPSSDTRLNRETVEDRARKARSSANFYKKEAKNKGAPSGSLWMLLSQQRAREAEKLESEAQKVARRQKHLRAMAVKQRLSQQPEDGWTISLTKAQKAAQRKAQQVAGTSSVHARRGSVGKTEGGCHTDNDAAFSQQLERAMNLSIRDAGKTPEPASNPDPRPLSSPAADEGSDDSCIICWSGKATHVVVPCGHQAYCSDCVPKTLADCPICRVPMTSVIKLFKR